jgi:hypothetical protein
VLLLLLFVYSVVVTSNDGKDAILWMTFYALHATLCGVSLVVRACCGKAMATTMTPIWFSAFAAVMALFSTFLMIASSIIMRRTDPSSAGDDVDNLDAKVEYLFDALGAAIGLFSAAYHAAIGTRLGRTTNNSQSLERGGTSQESSSRPSTSVV